MRLVLAPARVADSADVYLRTEDGDDFAFESAALLLFEESGGDGTRFVFDEPGVDGEYPWLVQVDTLLLAARAGHLEGFGVGEMANMRVSLDNRDKQASALLGYALRLRAWVYDDDDELYFAGSVQRFDPGYPLVLTLES